MGDCGWLWSERVSRTGKVQPGRHVFRCCREVRGALGKKRHGNLHDHQPVCRPARISQCSSPLSICLGERRHPALYFRANSPETPFPLDGLHRSIGTCCNRDHSLLAGGCGSAQRSLCDGHDPRNLRDFGPANSHCFCRNSVLCQGSSRPQCLAHGHSTGVECHRHDRGVICRNSECGVDNR
ncbi:hypothetical protein D9M71_632870 [compost metagenome]